MVQNFGKNVMPLHIQFFGVNDIHVVTLIVSLPVCCTMHQLLLGPKIWRIADVTVQYLCIQKVPMVEY